MRLRACLLIAALSLAPSAVALAATPDEVAKDEFREGREAFKRGDYKKALGLFQKSQATYPQVGTLLNLASCEEKLGMVASARQHFQQATAQLPDRDDRLPFARERIAALEPRVPRLRISLALGAPASTRVKLDDAPLAKESIDADMPVDPGNHVVVVSAAERPERRYEVKLAEGESSSLTVEPGFGNAAPPGGDTWWTGTRVVGVVVGSVGVVSLGIGAITGSAALGTKSDLEKLCPVPSSCTQAGVDQARTGKALSVASTVGLLVGAAAVGAGVVLVLTGGSQSRKPVAAVQLSPLPGGGALGLRGAF